MSKDSEGNIGQHSDVNTGKVVWPIKLELPHRQRFGIQALKDYLAGGKPLLLDLENLTELGLESPVEVGDVFRDFLFQPSPREIQVWGGGTSIVSQHEKEWGLGRGFLNQAQNQFYFAVLVDRSFKRTKEPDYKPSGIIPDRHNDLLRLLAYRMDRVLSLNNAHLARQEERIRYITKSALYIYSKLPLSDKIKLPLGQEFNK